MAEGDAIQATQSEIVDFIIGLSEDAGRREAFLRDRSAFLEGAEVSDDARKVLLSMNERVIRGSLQTRDAYTLTAVLVIVNHVVTVL